MGGLRGAVAFAQVVAYTGPYHLLYRDTVLSVILVTVVVNGVAARPLIHFLGLEARPDAGCGSNLLGQVVDGVAEMVGAEMCHVLGEGGDLHDWTTRIKMVEKNYVFPLLCKNGAGQTYLEREFMWAEVEWSKMLREKHLVYRLWLANINKKREIREEVKEEKRPEEV